MANSSFDDLNFSITKNEWNIPTDTSQTVQQLLRRSILTEIPPYQGSRQKYLYLMVQVNPDNVQPLIDFCFDRDVAILADPEIYSYEGHGTPISGGNKFVGFTVKEDEYAALENLGIPKITYKPRALDHAGFIDSSLPYQAIKKVFEMNRMDPPGGN